MRKCVFVLSVCFMASCGYKPNPNFGVDPSANTETFLTHISPDDVIQAPGNGDCWFASMLSAIAKTNPEYIRNSIKLTDTNDYEVSLYDIGNNYKPVYIKVAANSLDTNGVLSFVDDDGGLVLWPTIMYSAFVILNNETSFNSPAQDDSGLSQGGYPSRTYGTIVGKAGAEARIGIQIAKPDLYSFLLYANNVPIILETNKPTDPTLIGLHSYTVMNVSDTNNITIRNPWGAEDGTINGVRTLDMNTVLDNFAQITIPSALVDGT